MRCFNNVLRNKCTCVDFEKTKNKKRKLKTNPKMIKMVKRKTSKQGLKLSFKYNDII